MKVEMLMPQMGESIAEATILKWLKGIGDSVQKDETILEISTDKVDSEIPAPASGTLVELMAKQGETVAVKSIIAVIETEQGQASAQPKAAPAAKSSDTNGSAPNGSAPTGNAPSAPAPQAAPQPKSAPAAAPQEEIPAHVGERFYSPLVRSLATQYGLSSDELAGITGSGAQGRVTKNDVLEFIESRDSGVAPSASAAAAPAPATAAKAAPSKPALIEYGAEGIRVEPFDRMRKMIADHMVRSKATSPHVYSMTEVDVTNIAKWREMRQGQFLGREGFKLSFTPFFLEAVIKGLMQFPRINASVENETLILKRFVNLGCAVAMGKDGGEGLIVPVIKSADQLNLVGIARSLNDLAQRARNKKLSPDDIQGGTFTVTNPGTFGNTMGCPIINQPQLAILGIGAIKKRVAVVDNMIAIRDIVYLTLSYDHRVIDGALAGTFLQFITKYLEGWDMDRGV